MKFGGWIRLFIVYAAIVAAVGFLIFPRTDLLTAIVEMPERIGFFDPIYGEADDPFDTREAIFSKSDCVSNSISVRQLESPAVGPFDDLIPSNQGKPKPRFLLSCDGHEYRTETIVGIIAALFAPILFGAGFRWVRRGFHQNA